MKRNRWGFPVILSAAFIFLCSCTAEVPDLIESIKSEPVLTDVSGNGAHSDYKKLFAAYKTASEEYYKDTATAINSLLGQKYAYGMTAYMHDADLTDVAEMFFDDNSENNLGIYFALRGYEEKQYTETGNEAEFSAKKKGDLYSYRMSYDADAGSFEISLYVNDELKDSLQCSFDGETLVKCCYEGNLQRTFISRVNDEGASTVEWFDRQIVSPDETEANEDRGSVVYYGEMLSGVIK